MPELPEVETTRLSLLKNLEMGVCLQRVHFFRDNLRNQMPKVHAKSAEGQILRGIHRRAKYLIFEFETISFVTHLGMTGTWRFLAGERRLHDHIEMNFAGGATLIYNDPRRFGFFDTTPEGRAWTSHEKLRELGPEPLNPEFDSMYLTEMLSHRTAPIKSTLMDQKLVVGVGNIYASEALFRARVKPQRICRRLRPPEVAQLHNEIIGVLQEALQKGGSSISDFKDGQGQSGYFQNSFFVYDQAGNPCRICGTKIKSKYLAGRNTFWCPHCQR